MAASLFGKIVRFASSPQGRRAIRQAKEFANDPRRRQQAKDAVDRIKNKATGKDKGTPPPSSGQ